MVVVKEKEPMNAGGTRFEDDNNKLETVSKV